MEPFKRSEFDFETYVQGRNIYGTILIRINRCLTCSALMVKRTPGFSLKGLFHLGFGPDTQIRRAGWRYQHLDTDHCEHCTAQRIGFVCALCGMLRQTGKEAHTIGSGVWRKSICTSCAETQPYILIDKKRRELEQELEEHDDDDADSESDMG